MPKIMPKIHPRQPIHLPPIPPAQTIHFMPTPHPHRCKNYNKMNKYLQQGNNRVNIVKITL